MSNWIRYYLLPLSILLGYLQSGAQPLNSSQPTFLTADSTREPNWILINEVMITGNDKTRAPIIFREVPFQKGDTLLADELPGKLKLARDLLMNTTLL